MKCKECEKPAKNKGVCWGHYQKYRTTKHACGLCNEVFNVRKCFLKKKEKEGKKWLCMGCAFVERSGFSKKTNKDGYVIAHYKSYPREYWDILCKMCKSNGQIKDHRAVMAIYLGRPLLSNEEIHHKNGIKNDNRVENLEIFITTVSRQPRGQRKLDLLNEVNRLNVKIQQLQERLKCQ